MKKRSLIVGSTIVALLIGSILTLWKVSGVSAEERRVAYQALCQGHPSHIPSAKWHLLVYMDVNACLTCNEDMDAWRELADRLDDGGGEIMIWAPIEDSIDVAWAMELEGFHQKVSVLNPQIRHDLGWSGLGTPVKVLLDSLYQPVEIEGRLGNSKESAWFIESILRHIQS